MDFQKLLNNLTDKEKAYVILAYQWDFKAKELAVIFGVSESRVSQVLKEAKSKIKKTTLAEKKLFQ